MKNIKIYISFLLLFAMCFVFVSCASNENLVEMAYGTGMSDSGIYNSDLYLMNSVKLSGADPGAIYVPENRDPVYGGYYYIYITSGTYSFVSWNNSDDIQLKEQGKVGLGALCYRSKDLSSWEKAGSELGGFSLVYYEEDWNDCANGTLWAPEVVYNETEQMYYMFYNEPAKFKTEGSMSKSSSRNDRHYIGIAKSKTPVGPFVNVVKTETLSDGTEQRIPCINFTAAFNLNFDTPVIDVSPFVDDDGTLYIYFKTEGSTWTNTCTLYGMKMEDDWTTPIYDSITCVATMMTKSVTSGTGKDALLGTSVTSDGDFVDSPGCIEAPFMWKHNGKYYLTYTANGYTNPAYSVYQAIGDEPLGKFVKVGTDVGNPLLAGTQTQYVKGTGHHAFVSNGKEMFIIYHAHANETSYADGRRTRCVMSDRITWKTLDDGTEIMVANGPSKALCWLPEDLSGYKNVAKDAVITVDGQAEGVDYLNDGVLPHYQYNELETFTTNDDVTITLTFDAPVDVRSIMIYNSFYMDSAFSKIESIKLYFSETPAWASKDYDAGLISNLKFPSQYLDSNNSNYIVSCAPAVAEFNEVSVSKIVIKISKNDRLLEHDKLGNVNTALSIPEIVVLGR